MNCSKCLEPVQAGQRFCPNCGARLGDVAVVARASATADTAEHRQITVAFVDIVKSTSLVTALGVESYRELLRAYREIAARVVAKYKGHVSSFVGGMSRLMLKSAKRAWLT